MDGLVLRFKHILLFVVHIKILSAAPGLSDMSQLFSDSMLESWTWTRHPVLITTPYSRSGPQSGESRKKKEKGNTSMAGNLDTSHSVVITHV
jgi:hypothetical protein